MDILLWIDDERPMPKGFTHWTKSSSETIEFLSSITEEDVLVLVSFDHDLGLPWEDGHPMLDGGVRYDDVRPVVNWMMENRMVPHRVQIHSHNPVGARWIEREFLDSVPPEVGYSINILPFNPKNYN